MHVVTWRHPPSQFIFLLNCRRPSHPHQQMPTFSLITPFAHRSLSSSDTPPSSEFDAFFSAHYGPRWPSLATTLPSPTRHCALLNPWIDDNSARMVDKRATPYHRAMHDTSHTRLLSFPSSPSSASSAPTPWLTALLPTPPTTQQSYPPPRRDTSSSLLPWYWMDPASLVPPLALLLPTLWEPCSADEEMNVLDMCAAPGGTCISINYSYVHANTHKHTLFIYQQENRWSWPPFCFLLLHYHHRAWCAMKLIVREDFGYSLF